jgi:hypothetical protein
MRPHAAHLSQFHLWENARYQSAQDIPDLLTVLRRSSKVTVKSEKWRMSDHTQTILSFYTGCNGPYHAPIA